MLRFQKVVETNIYVGDLHMDTVQESGVTITSGAFKVHVYDGIAVFDRIVRTFHRYGQSFEPLVPLMLYVEICVQHGEVE